MSRTALQRTSATWSALLHHRSARLGALTHMQRRWESCRPLRRHYRWFILLAAKIGGRGGHQRKVEEECWEEGKSLGYVLKEPLLASSYTPLKRIIPSSVALLLVALESSAGLLEEKWVILKGKEGERGGRDQDEPLICHVMTTLFYEMAALTPLKHRMTPRETPQVIFDPVAVTRATTAPATVHA